jgi:molybdopterin synthase catalytic subunit
MVEIRTEDFSPDEVLKEIKSPNTGAVVYFIGVVKNGIEELKVECQPEKTQQELEKLERQAQERFGVEKVVIIQRYGHLKVKDNICLVAATSQHRQEAFQAVEFLIDEIKKVVPIKEIR